MLIQNTSNLAQASVPAPLASNGGPVGFVPQASHAVETTQSQAQAATKQAAVQKPTDAQLAKEIDKINSVLQQANKSLELNFSVDKATNRQVVKLVDKQTGDTLLQYPSEAVLAISQGIDEFQHGLLLKQKA